VPKKSSIVTDIYFQSVFGIEMKKSIIPKDPVLTRPFKRTLFALFTNSHCTLWEAKIDNKKIPGAKERPEPAGCLTGQGDACSLPPNPPRVEEGPWVLELRTLW
jgi:hypothetical protein